MRNTRTLQPGHALALLLFLIMPVASGCFSPWLSADADSESPGNPRREAIREKLQSKERPRTVAQIGSAQLTLSRLENIGLLTRLDGTGGVVRASQPRERMLATMRRNDVDQPNSILDDPRTAMVVATLAVPPAANVGDILDVSVHVSSHSDATDLQNGWLLETSLVEMSNVGGQIRQGFEYAVAEGPLVTRAQITGSEEESDKLAGIIVGGARLVKGRGLRVTIDHEFADALTMAAILPAINRRFTVFDGRKQVGVAVPQEESFISLAVPPRYQYDPFHFINVVQQVSFNETDSQKIERVELLRQQLADPTKARTACWQLEAIGEEAVEILAPAANHPDREVRFYAAHSLAYLNDQRAIAPLAELCRQEPAFRAMCLNGLTIIDSHQADEALTDLLHAADAESRYGALLALRNRDKNNPQVTGQQIGEVGSILEIPSAGPPLVVVSLHQTPEVAIFGANPQLTLPAFLYVTPRMIIRSDGPDAVTVSRFVPDREDRLVQAQTDLRSVLNAISEVGGSYGDWVSFLRQCSEQGYLTEPLAINPIPQSGRTYHRESRRQPADDQGLRDLTEHGSLDPLTGPTGEASPSAEDSTSSVWYNPLSW